MRHLRVDERVFVRQPKRLRRFIYGQWLGRYSGTNTGTLVIDLDDVGTHYEGRACAYDDNTSIPSAFILIKTTGKANTFHLRLPVLPMDTRTGEPTAWNNLASLYPGAAFPEYAEVDLKCVGEVIDVRWTTDIGTFGSAKILRSKAGAPSEYERFHNINTWDDFKNYVNTLEHRRYIFRGQAKLQRLRTSFHRTGRADLGRFIEQDIKTLHRHLSLRTTHVFNLTIPDENGAFFNLVQHHGYPTPLLDWSFSPFVAAFFAYHGIKNSEAARAGAQKVRIFVFNQKEWRARIPQISKVTPARPHFSILEFIAIDNERLIPQQSISSLR